MPMRQADTQRPVPTESPRPDDHEVGHYEDPSFESQVPWAVESAPGGRGG